MLTTIRTLSRASSNSPTSNAVIWTARPEVVRREPDMLDERI